MGHSTNPLAGQTFDTQGPDTHAIALRPAPTFSDKVTAAEMAELYWMALLRDLTFTRFPDYKIHDLIPHEAVKDLNTYRFFADFNGAGQPLRFEQLFRAHLPGNADSFKGVDVGPHVSQFLLRGTPEFSGTLDGKGNCRLRETTSPQQGTIGFGALRLSQRQRTVLSGSDFLTTEKSWRAVQSGLNPSGCDQFDASTLRFIRNMRDLANYVHFDKIYQEYFIAACILLSFVPRTGALKSAEVRAGGTAPTPANLTRSSRPSVGQSALFLLPADPNVLNDQNPYKTSQAQNGFATFGATHILTGLAEVATRAHRAAFFQKWMVHRRIRPEEFGGRLHFHLTGQTKYPSLPAELVGQDKKPPTPVLKHVKRVFGSYLLPQVFVEGCPTHPSYPAAHATLAGASVTMLKAFFNEAFKLEEVFVPVPSQGVALMPYQAPKGEAPLTVGGELNKLASNVAFGRSMAGVHWRSDNIGGLLLGEQIAIGLLKEQSLGFPEKRTKNGNGIYFEFTKFDGTKVQIKNGACTVIGNGIYEQNTVDWK